MPISKNCTHVASLAAAARHLYARNASRSQQAIDTMKRHGREERPGQGLYHLSQFQFLIATGRPTCVDQDGDGKDEANLLWLLMSMSC
jgi:hypothetical protein